MAEHGSLLCRIYGRPAPQGSKSAAVVNGRAVMWESSKTVKAWRSRVAAELAQAYFGDRRDPIPAHQPVRVIINFTLAHSPRSKLSEPTAKPDLDKLTRAILDALTASLVIADDSQVTQLLLSKSFGREPGAEIGVIW